jgi:hypothetical protein
MLDLSLELERFVPAPDAEKHLFLLDHFASQEAAEGFGILGVFVVDCEDDIAWRDGNSRKTRKLVLTKKKRAQNPLRI